MDGKHSINGSLIKLQKENKNFRVKEQSMNYIIMFFWFPIDEKFRKYLRYYFREHLMSKRIVEF